MRKKDGYRRGYWRAAVVFAVAAAGLWEISGCGIVTAPVSVPGAIAENADFSFNFTPVDIKGAPLDGVLMAEELNHHFWTPIAGGTDTDEQHLRRIDHNYTVSERGQTLALTFTRDGFRQASVTFNTSDPHIISTPDGDWPNVKNFPLVMLPAGGNDPRLRWWTGPIDYNTYPQQETLRFGNLAAATRNGFLGVPALAPASADNTAAMPDGTFYVTIERQPPRTIDAQGDVDPVEVNLPARVTLHLKADDGGFLRIAPQIGFAPMLTTDAAPTGAYQPELTIQRDRLKEMRLAPSNRIMQQQEYFFFRVDGRYGKGEIGWQQQFTEGFRGTPALVFVYRIWVQPTPGETSLVVRQERNN